MLPENAMAFARVCELETLNNVVSDDGIENEAKYVPDTKFIPVPVLYCDPVA